MQDQGTEGRITDQTTECLMAGSTVNWCILLFGLELLAGKAAHTRIWFAQSISDTHWPIQGRWGNWELKHLYWSDWWKVLQPLSWLSPPYTRQVSLVLDSIGDKPVINQSSCKVGKIQVSGFRGVVYTGIYLYILIPVYTVLIYLPPKVIHSHVGVWYIPVYTGIY